MVPAILALATMQATAVGSAVQKIDAILAINRRPFGSFHEIIGPTMYALGKTS